MSAPRDHLRAWEQLFRAWRAWYPVPVRVLIDQLIDLDCVNDPSKPLSGADVGYEARWWQKLLKALREAHDKLPATVEPPVVIEPAGRGKYRFTVRVTVPHDYNPKDMVAKLEAHRGRNRVARPGLSTHEHDLLGYHTDQTIGMGKPVRPLPYPAIQKGNAPVRVGERRYYEINAGLRGKGAIIITSRARQATTYAVNLDWTPPAGEGRKRTIPQVKTNDPAGDGAASANDPAGETRTIPQAINRPIELASTEKNMSLTNVAPEAARVAGVSDLSAEEGSPSKAPAAPSREAVRKRQVNRLRHVWVSTLAKADWRPPGQSVPAWTQQEKAIAASFIGRLHDLDTAAGFLEWNVEHWRAIRKHALAGLRCPASPSIRTIARYFDHLHGAWQRGAQREWLDTLPFEERNLAAKMAAGMTREAALLEIAEERAVAKHRDEFAAAERRANEATRIAVASERAAELAWRRASTKRPAVRTRTRPAGPILRDVTEDEIKRVFDEQMASFTPPDWDQDPYADPAAG